MGEVGLVNCGSGNFGSVRNALRRLGVEPLEVRGPGDAERCEGMILPGVGAFPEFMRRLGDRGLVDSIRRHAEGGKPLLGICVGMQVLADEGDEFGPTPGLGLIRGRVERLPAAPGVRIPHMGWNTVTPARACPVLGESEGSFYFVHSFAMRPADPGDIAGEAEHGVRFAAAVGRGSVFGVQFHPEKSQRDGLRVLGRFVEICRPACKEAA